MQIELFDLHFKNTSSLPYWMVCHVPPRPITTLTHHGVKVSLGVMRRGAVCSSEEGLFHDVVPVLVAGCLCSHVQGNTTEVHLAVVRGHLGEFLLVELIGEQTVQQGF